MWPIVIFCWQSIISDWFKWPVKYSFLGKPVIQYSCPMYSVMNPVMFILWADSVIPFYIPFDKWYISYWWCIVETMTDDDTWLSFVFWYESDWLTYYSVLYIQYLYFIIVYFDNGNTFWWWYIHSWYLLTVDSDDGMF
jgi:hypothetical protein